MGKEELSTLFRYERLERDGLGIYVYPDYPDWFVPSVAGDRLLRGVQETRSLPPAGEKIRGVEVSRPAAEQFLARLAREDAAAYSGRAAHLQLKELKECWFHVANRCNLNCTHCMFSSGPAQQQRLSPEQLAGAVEQARNLGCTVFYFTGGEPLIYDGFFDVCRRILRDP